MGKSLPGYQGVNMIRLLLLVAACLAVAESLSCSCGSSPCQTPVCCDSGYYTLDECGCCLTCAKAEDEVCGGPFRIAGNCAAGLRCLRQCDCQTVQGSQCIFPFTYKGVTHNSCTKVDSDNGAAWCATELQPNGEVVNNKWEDCGELCPGTDFKCNENFLFNMEGVCVNGTEAPELLRQAQAGPLAAILDDIPSETSQKPAPACSLARDTEEVCRCTREATLKGIDGNPKGGCVPPRDDIGLQELEFGWCFLENIQDPHNPTLGCYEDVQWSEVDGRFWSNSACFQENQQPHVCQSTLNKPCIFPFTYKSVVHEKCTHVGSENGAAWCATEVDEAGVVVRNAWEDCQSGCPIEEENTN